MEREKKLEHRARAESFYEAEANSFPVVDKNYFYTWTGESNQGRGKVDAEGLNSLKCLPSISRKNLKRVNTQTHLLHL